MTQPVCQFRRFALLATALVLFLAACGGDDDNSTAGDDRTTTSSTIAPDDDASAAAFPVAIEHALGTTEIPAEPERIVSASGTMTGHLLAIDASVVAAQVLPPASPLADDNGFLIQWADVAVDRGVEPLAGPEVDIEAIAAADPDLIVGNSFGGDAIDENVYALLSEIAPTIVIDHSGQQWQELAATLAEATGRTDETDAAIEEFDALVASATELDTSLPVVPLVVSPEGINVLTPTSAHGQLLEALGYEVVDVEGSNLDGEAGAGSRADVVSVSPELLADEFGDATLLFVFADQAAVDDALEANPTLAALPAVGGGRVIPLGFESFRLDRYSASAVVATLIAA